MGYQSPHILRWKKTLEVPQLQLTLEHIFPKLAQSIPHGRRERLEGIIDRFFNHTLTFTDDGLPFVITGDIPAMWLRDSTWQVAPFLHSDHSAVAELLTDLSLAQMKYFLIDPFANAFNPTPSGNCWHKDFVDQSPWVFERKFELDSWASLLFLARKIKERWGITRHLGDQFAEVLSVMIDLARQEQRHDRESYRFFRQNGVPHDSLSHDGLGAPVAFTGMIYSGFRPSDDACVYGYLIPANLFFLNELNALDLSLRPKDLIQDIESGISKFGISDRGFAYEVDGLGNQLFIDDANIPSLLSLPFLEVCKPDYLIYLKTRKRLLSSENPYFYSGKFSAGIGSPHTPVGYIWPIAIAVQALTDLSAAAIPDAISCLEATDAGTGKMHESFDADNPHQFTRGWFSWADAMYLELVIRSSQVGN